MAEITVTVPQVSVAIAAYNEEAFLEGTIRSILACGFPCQLIVVDDGSTDRTPEILARYASRLDVVRHPSNRGKGAAVASAMDVARGDIIVLCDAHLLGLDQHHLLTLVSPLLRGETQAVLGIEAPRGLSLAREVPARSSGRTFPLGRTTIDIKSS